MKAISVELILSTTEPKFKAVAKSGDMELHIELGSDVNFGESARDAAMTLAKGAQYQGAWVGERLPNGQYAFLCIDESTPLMIGVK